MMRLLPVLALVFFAAACPANDPPSGPVDTCQKVGQQCRMSGGQLGVCSMKSDGQLFCMSQH